MSVEMKEVYLRYKNEAQTAERICSCFLDTMVTAYLSCEDRSSSAISRSSLVS